MKKLAIFVGLSLLGLGVYNFFFCAKEPTLYSMTRQSLECAIQDLFSPLSYDSPLIDLSDLRNRLSMLQETVSASEKQQYTAMFNIYQALSSAAQERNTFVKRLASNRINTKQLAIVSGRPVVSYSHRGRYAWTSQGAEHSPKHDAKVREENRQMRIRHFENAILNQWQERSVQLRRSVMMTYETLPLEQ
jgi:hypothetical protein